MPTGQPGFFVIDSGGKVTYRFAGQVFADGVTLPASDNEDLHERNAVNWIRSNGSLMAQIQAIDIPAINFSSLAVDITPRNDADEVSIAHRVQGGPTAANQRQVSLTMGRTTLDATTQIDVQAKSGVSPFTYYIRTLLDAAGRSSFLQLNAPGNLKLQIGSGAVALPVATSGAVVANLGFAWPNNHLLFLATMRPLTNGVNYRVTYNHPLSLSQGQIVYDNPVAQNATYQWLSIGN